MKYIMFSFTECIYMLLRKNNEIEEIIQKVNLTSRTTSKIFCTICNAFLLQKIMRMKKHKITNIYIPIQYMHQNYIVIL